MFNSPQRRKERKDLNIKKEASIKGYCLCSMNHNPLTSLFISLGFSLRPLRLCGELYFTGFFLWVCLARDIV